MHFYCISRAQKRGSWVAFTWWIGILCSHLCCLLWNKGSTRLQPHVRQSESTSSLVSEREYITSLDLSANELRDVDALSHRGCLSTHLEHLERLELQQNALASFPQPLCEVRVAAPLGAP